MSSRENNIFLLRRKVVTFLLIVSTFFKLSFAGIYVPPCTTPKSGAIAKFYDYPLLDNTSFKNESFILGGYLKNKYEGEVTGITDISWDSLWPAVVPPYGFEGVPIHNFLMTVSAYYRAPQSGVYNFSLKVDDFAAIYVGIDAATDYCDMHDYVFAADEFLVNNTGSAARGLTAATQKTYMQEGWYYPIQIVYVNYMERGVLNVEVTKPDGTVDTDFGKRLYAIPNPSTGNSSAVFITGYDTFTRSFVSGLTAPTTVSTSTYTDWLNYETADVDIFYYVDEPLSTALPSITTGISVPTTSMYTTEVTGSIDYSTTKGVSVPTTSTYTTVVTGSFGTSAPEVFFNFDIEVEVRY